jgi:Mg2+/Co2+ transporter CorB
LAEASILASSKSRVHKLRQEGNKNARNLEKILDRKEALISIVLFGNNAVNILASAIVTIVAIEYISPVNRFYEYAPLIGSIILTVIVLIFTEIIPKTIAMNKPERVANSLYVFYVVLEKVLGPVLIIINGFVRWLLNLFGFKNAGTLNAADTIRSEIEYHHFKGSVIKNDKDMLEGVLDLVEMDVQTVMTHRKDVDMIDIQNTMEEIIDIINETPHTRLPIYDDTPDKIQGILHLKDFLVLSHNKKEISREDLKSILITPFFVPLNIKLKTLLMEFKKKRCHMAIVVDEYGGMMGIVTLEDIIEQIVGTIEDEHDDFENSIIEEKEGVYIVDGECQISDFNREIGCHFNYEDASTMAGLVLDMAEKIPEEGEEFIITNFKFTILKKEMSKINLIKVERLVTSEDSDDN